ncbi:membrane-bound PQQ-dependent dehydrogenase, glucose/quinate/shikimate family [Inquilinus sp. CAU 1745]|uniref:membrane-bound PQQ-dependent dehydrogenase, glucose/quinate/shikimate family n=1 Tax=Inquilinus sp. CAU 1745 TaxID=3140369 RepID=UPI00325BAFBE
MYRIALSIIVFLIGLLLGAGGVWLATLGGSWFYIALGVALVVSAILLTVRRPAGLALYGATMIVTLAWAVWESGFDWWALSARGSLLLVIGVLLLMPPMVRAMRKPPEPKAGYGVNAGVLAASLAICAAVGVYAMFQNPNEIVGAFEDERMAATEDLETGVPDGEWAAYGRTSAGRRYSPLTEITPENVAGLGVAWTYHTGDVRGPDDPVETTYEVTPLMVDDRLYICTPHSIVIALDPITGEEIWRFDPLLKQPPTTTTQHMTCRGVTYFDGSDATVEEEPSPAATAVDRVELSAAEVTTEAAGEPQNVVTEQATIDEPNPDIDREPPGEAGAGGPECVRRVFVSTSDGRLISLSAETGEICPGFGGEDGTVNLWANMPNVTPGSVYSTSPAVATDRLIIIGGAVNDNASVTSPSGVIRAYDAFTGELVWNFDSKNPQATEPIANGETYSENAPNSWSVSSYDPDLGLVYLPMGNESPDQYGGDRGPDVERFSSSILALDADTGEVAWGYQMAHHDIWDYDAPAQPSLIDLTIDGQTVPALVAATKQGEIFVLNRETGEPALPVEGVPVPQEGAVEGETTAPTQPVSTISFNPEPLTGADMWGATPLDQLACRIAFHQHNYRGRYTPPSTNGTIVYPGNFGTFNWGAVAVDPNRDVMFAMPVYLAFTVKLVPREDPLTRVVTEAGDPVFNENFGAPYAVEIGAFMSRIGLPCQGPPWGYIAGVDLRTGETVYKHVNGTVRDLSPVPLPFEMGVPGIGGPIVTGGGVAFLSGTLDYYVRGYDLQTGEEIWRARLPAGGQATPSTYLGADGRQYLVVVAGGHGSTGTAAGDAIIAYALPSGS